MRLSTLFKAGALFTWGLLVGIASAQTNTTVSATVVDSDSTVWANALWTISFVPGALQSNPYAYTANGTPVTAGGILQAGALNGSGVLSVTLYNSVLMAPQGGSWKLSLCPSASVPCSTYNFTTNGSSLDISSGVNATITAPRFLAVAGAYGYADVEAQQAVIPLGATYWNVGSSCQKYYNGSAWICPSGGSTTTQSLTANSSNTGAASPSSFNGGTAVSWSANTFGAGSLANANTWSGTNVFSGAGTALTVTNSANINSAFLGNSVMNQLGFYAWTNSNTVGAGSRTTVVCQEAAGIVEVGNGAACAATGTLDAQLYKSTLGTAIASATTIAPVNSIVHVTGTAAIVTITPPFTTGCLTLIADGIFTWTAAGNIKLAGTAVANTPYSACYDGTSWFIK